MIAVAYPKIMAMGSECSAPRLSVIFLNAWMIQNRKRRNAAMARQRLGMMPILGETIHKIKMLRMRPRILKTEFREVSLPESISGRKVPIMPKTRNRMALNSEVIPAV